MTTDRGLRIGETILGLVILALGLFIAIETWRMPVMIVTAAVGPKFFPAIVATGLIGTSAFLLREALAGVLAHRRGVELDGVAVGIVLAALLAQIVLLSTLGWILASAILFVGVAYAFGSRRPLTNFAVGLALGGLSFAVFDYGLDLNLPTGRLIEQLIDTVHPK